jgi:hypothetical protein
MCEDFTPNFGDKRASYYVTTTHRPKLPFHQRIFDRNNMTVVRHSSNFSVSPIEDKTETPHFLHN